MKSKIRKIGNSLGLTIPSDITKLCLFELGDSVELTVEEGKLIITKAHERVPVIPNRPINEMSFDELKKELTSGFALSVEIIESGREDLIPQSVVRANQVLEEFNTRLNSDIEKAVSEI